MAGRPLASTSETALSCPPPDRPLDRFGEKLSI